MDRATPPETIEPLLISLPIADRPRAHAFYRDGFGLEAVGEVADDGIPEPLVFVLNAATRLMLIPAGGFGWVIGGRSVVAAAAASECLLGITVATDADVDEVVERARAAGATVESEPASQPWGYAATFADVDGHLWTVTSATLAG
jgi:predicted lactoylglutathione lyase